MDGYVCSYLEVSNCTCTGNPSGNLCFGEEKLRMMKEYCIKNTMSLSDSWYYGDSLSDLPALLAAGTPVCVNPDRGLAREARQRNWKVLRWKS
jgi:phosphoserine phosphatase